MDTGRDSTERFGALVEDYDKYRPGYPQEAIEHLVACGLNPDSVVADVGSGTGISTRYFLDLGCEVYAVEPNAPMRAAAEARFASNPRFHSIAGGADDTTLPAASVDWVIAAQAFHWFDRPRARGEFSRILKPGGIVALIFNERSTTATPFLRSYEGILLKHSIDYEKVNHANLGPEVFDSFFRSYQLATFPNSQIVDLDRLLGRVRSCSYVPHPGDPGWPALEADIRALYAEHEQGGSVALLYDTLVYWGSV